MLLKDIKISDEIKELLTHFKGGCYEYINNFTRFAVKDVPEDNVIRISYNSNFRSFALVEIRNDIIWRIHYSKYSYHFNQEAELKTVNAIQNLIFEGKELFDKIEFEETKFFEQLNIQLKDTNERNEWFNHNKNNIMKDGYSYLFEDKHKNILNYIDKLESQKNETPSIFWK